MSTDCQPANRATGLPDWKCSGLAIRRASRLFRPPDRRVAPLPQMAVRSCGRVKFPNGNMGVRELMRFVRYQYRFQWVALPGCNRGPPSSRLLTQWPVSAGASSDQRNLQTNAHSGVLALREHRSAVH